MIRYALTNLGKRKKLLAIIPFLEKENLYDRVEDDQLTVNPENLTGWERIINLFRPHDGHPVHPSIALIGNMMFASLFGGGVIGAFKESRETFISFIENNEATQFRSHMDAKRKLSDQMILAWGKGFVKLGPKVSIICTTLVATEILLTTYRNKYSFLHHTYGGMAAGAIYKINFGFKGMISGAIFGGFFGTVFGISHSLLLKITNISEDELLEYKLSQSYSREEGMVKAKKDILYKEDKEGMLEILQNTCN